MLLPGPQPPPSNPYQGLAVEPAAIFGFQSVSGETAAPETAENGQHPQEQGSPLAMGVTLPGGPFGSPESVAGREGEGGASQHAQQPEQTHQDDGSALYNAYMHLANNILLIDADAAAEVSLPSNISHPGIIVRPCREVSM